MKKFILLLLAIILGFIVSQAQHYAGYWTGYITQHSASAIANNYHFSLSLEIEGTQIAGTSEIRLWDDVNIMGTMELKGSFSGERIELQELKIIKQEIYTFAYWCLKLLKMQYIITDGKETLQGHWESELCNGPGEIYLERMPAT